MKCGVIKSVGALLSLDVATDEAHALIQLDFPSLPLCAAALSRVFSP